MLARTLCFALVGVSGEPVDVQAYVSGGSQYQFSMVGLPDAAVKESRDRVAAAIKNSGFAMPYGHTTVNLSPADVRKEGTAFDLPIAVAIIQATQQLKCYGLQDTVLLGELALDGSLVPVQGVLPLVISAKERGINKVLLPIKNAPEVEAVEGMQVFGCRSLYEAMQHLSNKNSILAQVQKSYQECLKKPKDEGMDLSQVRGQQSAKRALEVAAAGGHNLLFVGVPGSGKTMLARCLPGILPQMTQQEAFETTLIYSASGIMPAGTGLITTRPFRAPHHTASAAALIGGGVSAKPGEVSLAHNGVLFLDEMPEYPRRVLEALRQPLEDGFATVSRVRAHVEYLSRFMLVASMNPCPCGYFGSRTRPCRCGNRDIRKYLDRISGPLLDRIDIQVEADSVPVEEIASKVKGENSATVRQRVENARLIQLKRFKEENIFCNAQMNNKHIEKYALAEENALKFIQQAIKKFGLSMRAYGRMIKVARTIADLKQQETIKLEDAAEAVQFRMIDAKYWGGAEE
ncbi:MAG: YifB family Mg chelatase-like AAA ATPase [Eubacteriales bacterium]|nr:YifB family Mg chelatase-like AAA ATPase [Eubacteriales bacterium]